MLIGDSSHTVGIMLSSCSVLLHSQLVHLRWWCHVTPLEVLLSSRLSENINNASTIHRLAIISGGQTSQSICCLIAPDTVMTWHKNERYAPDP